MPSSEYRVSKEAILNIAEHCDLETLSNLAQTSKDIRSLVTDYEHSISQAKIAASKQPLQGLVLSSEDEQRCTILVRNSFATLRELERRSQRCDSLLNRGAFLLTSEPEILGMTQESLEKFKAGLQHAFWLADQLADLATCFTITETPPSSPNTNAALNNTLSLDTDYRQQRATTALRHAQIAHLRKLPSRALAWLVTLAAGASKGYARYSTRLLVVDPAMADARVMAFKEVLLRHGGSLVVWGFMRGTGTLAQFVKQAVAQCAEEVLFFEESGQQVIPTFGDEDDEADGEEDVPYSDGVMRVPAGLHMSIIQELNRRIALSKRNEAEEKGEMWFDDEVETSEVWEEVNKLVAQEVACPGWRGYGAVKYPCGDNGA
ncbi:unnamed protein product [Discula destructiva]